MEQKNELYDIAEAFRDTVAQDTICLWSNCFGYVNFRVDYPQISVKGPAFDIILDKYGRMSKEGECVLWPTKDHQSWEDWQCCLMKEGDIIKTEFGEVLKITEVTYGSKFATTCGQSRLNFVVDLRNSVFAKRYECEAYCKLMDEEEHSTPTDNMSETFFKVLEAVDKGIDTAIDILKEPMTPENALTLRMGDKMAAIGSLNSLLGIRLILKPEDHDYINKKIEESGLTERRKFGWKDFLVGP